MLSIGVVYVCSTLVVIHNYIIMLSLLLVKSVMHLLLTIIILVCLAHFVIENCIAMLMIV